MFDSNELFVRLIERSIISITLKSSVSALSEFLENSSHLLDTCARYGESLGVPDEATVDRSIATQLAPSRDVAERLEALCAEYESRTSDAHEQYIRQDTVDTDLLVDIDRLETQLKDALDDGSTRDLLDKPEQVIRAVRDAYEAMSGYELSRDAISEITSRAEAIDEMLVNMQELTRLISRNISELASALDEPVIDK